MIISRSHDHNMKKQFPQTGHSETCHFSQDIHLFFFFPKHSHHVIFSDATCKNDQKIQEILWNKASKLTQPKQGFFPRCYYQRLRNLRAPVQGQFHSWFMLLLAQISNVLPMKLDEIYFSLLL